MFTLNITRGDTLTRVIRWGAGPVVYKPISAVVALSPLRLTVTGHGMLAGWSAALTDIVGMVEANAPSTLNNPGAAPLLNEYHQATVIDVNTVEFNDINAASFGAYGSGGVLRYNTPVNLAGFTAKMEIRLKPDSPILATFTTADGSIVIDNTAKTITVNGLASVMAALAFNSGVFDLAMSDSSVPAKVTTIIKGGTILMKNVTA